MDFIKAYCEAAYGAGGGRYAAEFFDFIGDYGKGNAWDLCGNRTFDLGGECDGEAVSQRGGDRGVRINES